MMYWDLLLNEVAHNIDPIKSNLLFSSKKTVTGGVSMPSHGRHSRRSYQVGGKYKHTYLTKREAECVYYLLRGNSGRMIAATLNISRRTVESYIDNVKNKLDCRKRAELIAIILDSDLLANIDFI